MSPAWLALLALVVPIRPDAGVEIPVDCPAGATTRVVFPEPLRALRVDARAKAALGIVVERTAPQGVVAVSPKRPGADAIAVFEGPVLTLRLRLRAVGAGSGGEVRLVREVEAAVTPAPIPTATPVPSPTPAPTVIAMPTPAPTARGDVGELLRAEAIPIGRREGLPGEGQMVLVDALTGRSSVWLRFVLERGAGETVEAVIWEKGRVADVVAEPVGKDLRLVVALPREGLGRRSIVSVRVGGRAYEFAFSTSPFRALLKALER